MTIGLCCTTATEATPSPHAIPSDQSGGMEPAAFTRRTANVTTPKREVMNVLARAADAGWQTSDGLTQRRQACHEEGGNGAGRERLRHTGMGLNAPLRFADEEL
jgi:hypothetical protein